MMKKLMLMVLVLALAICLFVACGGPAETEAPDSETNPPETEAPQCNGDDIHAIVVEEKAADCQTRGYRIETCSICGEVISEYAVPKTACTPAAPATCTADSICSVCGDVIEAATGHAWGDAQVTVATCQVEGKSVTACANNCGETRETVLPKIDHVIGTVTEEVAPTSCSQNGYKKGTCVTCGVPVTVDLAIAHAYDNSSFVIGNDGSISGTCSTCGVQSALDLDILLKLDFEGTDIRSEVEASPKGEYFTVYDKTNSTAKFETVGDRTVLSTSSAPAFIDFDPTYFIGSSYYVVSFDFSYNAERNYGETRPSLFSFIYGWGEDGSLKVSNVDWGNCAKLDTVNMKLGAVSSNNTELTDANSIDVALGEWHNVTVVVNNVTGARNVYFDGVYMGTPTKSGAITEKNIEKFQYYCIRFNDQSLNKPLIDNFRFYIVE